MLFDVSIIIVNYNTRDLLFDCLSSIIEKSRDLNYEIIVSDNGSSDGSIEMIREFFCDIVLVENKSNIGFGAANNRAARIARGKYIFYLNSDTILLNNAAKIFYDFWEEYKHIYNIGCLGCTLLNKELVPVHSWGRFPTPKNTLITLFHMYLFPHVKFRKEEKEEVMPASWRSVNGYITGAALFLKNDQTALFDERYFMYAEETDLEYNNFYRNNRERLIISDVRIIHLGGGSDNSATTLLYDFSKLSVMNYWISIVKYLRKNYSGENVTIEIIKKILIHIWKMDKYKDRTGRFVEQIKGI